MPGLVVSESAGLQQPLGIEAVRWSAGTGSELVVRVSGRWRRRRAATTTVPLVLAIDTEYQRYRFPALPEPPSMRGAQPGLWQVSFSIPASLAPYLGGRLTLVLGSVSIALPPAVADPGVAPGPSPPRIVVDPSVLADRRERRAELAEREARRRAVEAEAATGEARALLDRLELELTHAREDSERLGDELSRAERRRREAEQLAHSERAMRLDLGRDHAERIRHHQAEARAVLELLEAAQAHAEDLGQEIERLRRSRVVVARRPGASERRARALAAERALARSTPCAPVPAQRPALVGEPAALALERAMRASRWRARGRGESALAGALLRLAAERAEGEEALSRGPDAERAQAQYVTEAIEAIARQLDAVRAVVVLLPEAAVAEVGRAAPHASRTRQARLPPGAPAAAVAPDRLAAALYRLREEHPAAEGAVGVEPGSGAVVPGAVVPGAVVADAVVPGAVVPGAVVPGVPSTLAAELAAARGRGRRGGAVAERRAAVAVAPVPIGGPAAGGHAEAAERAAPAAPIAPVAPVPSVGPAAPGASAASAASAAPAAPDSPTARWLLPALKRLLRDDPAVVGNLVIRLVPAQSLVVAGPVRYDIALVGAGSLAVTVMDDKVRLDVLAAPRLLDEVDFRVEGDLEALGRLLVYGRLRRRLSRRVARIRGDRRAFAALAWLVREPLGLGELHAAGLRLDPELTLRLIASMIDPSWTARERFTVGHESPGGGGRVYLFVRDGTQPRVSRQPPLGPVASTIRCADERLLPLLAGGSGEEMPVRGAAAPVALVCDWIARAQRDS